MIRSSTPRVPAPGIDPQRQHRNRRRLAGVIDLARIYRNLGVKELADRVHRDKTRLIPETGNPKIDLVVSLAAALEWPLTDVVEAILGRPGDEAHPVLRMHHRFEDLEELARRACAAGHQRALAAIGRRMDAVAVDSRQRAASCCWRGRASAARGLYPEALERFRAGLNHTFEERSLRLGLRINLADAYRLNGDLPEAETIASETIREVRAAGASTSQRLNRSTLAHALFVRGESSRRRLLRGFDGRTLERSISDLERAERLLGQLRRVGHSGLEDDLASGCRRGLLALSVTTGGTGPGEALQRIREHLGADESTSDGVRTPCNEDDGWWAGCGAELAWRHLEGPERLETTRRFAEQAIDVGVQLGHFGLQAAGFRHLLDVHRAGNPDGVRSQAAHLPPPRLVQLVRLMGRLPEVRDCGWGLLEETGTLDHATRMDPRTWRKGLQLVDKNGFSAGSAEKSTNKSDEKGQHLLDRV